MWVEFISLWYQTVSTNLPTQVATEKKNQQWVKIVIWNQSESKQLWIRTNLTDTYLNVWRIRTWMCDGYVNTYLCDGNVLTTWFCVPDSGYRIRTWLIVCAGYLLALCRMRKWLMLCAGYLLDSWFCVPDTCLIVYALLVLIVSYSLDLCAWISQNKSLPNSGTREWLSVSSVPLCHSGLTSSFWNSKYWRIFVCTYTVLRSFTYKVTGWMNE
jgi:hypothetical protein